MRIRWWKLGIGVVALAIILIGLRFVADPLFVRSPDSVRIVVTAQQDSTGHKLVIFDQQYSQQASALYQRLTANERYQPTETVSCPAIPFTQPYYTYQLTFFHLGLKVATATDDARGCAIFHISYLDSSSALYAWQTLNHDSYWLYLHHTVNAPLPISTFVQA